MKKVIENINSQADCKLYQRCFLTQNTYTLAEGGILVNEKRAFSSKKYMVPFENIAAERTEISYSSAIWFWAMLILWSLSILTLVLLFLGKDVDSLAYAFWGFLAVIATIIYLYSRTSHVILVAGQPGLILHKNVPSKEEMEAFIETVNIAKKNYLTQHYLIGTSDASKADAIHKLSWLKEHGIITQSDFDILKRDIVDSAKGESNPRISFN